MAKDRINAAAVSSENAAKQGRPIEFEKLIWIMAAVFKQNNKASISPKVIAAMSGQKWSEHAIQHYFREVNRQAKALADEVSEGNNGTDVTTPTKSTTGAVGGAGENKKKRKGKFPRLDWGIRDANPIAQALGSPMSRRTPVLKMMNLNKPRFQRSRRSARSPKSRAKMRSSRCHGSLRTGCDGRWMGIP